jgi:Fur family peroxide stress response transcriptional regulator
MIRKHSKKRDEILRIIQSTSVHPSARWVYDMLKPTIPDLSLGTVYRNITVFQNGGEVVSVGVVTGEERFDGRTEPHPHAICSICGAVHDLPYTAADVTQPVAGDFVIDYRKTVFHGICAECAQKQGS